MVTMQAELKAFNNTGDVTIQIQGSPYADEEPGLGSVMSRFFDNPPNASLINNGIIQFYKSGDNKNQTWAAVKHQDMLNASSSIWFSLSYRTDDTTWAPINGATIQ